MGHSITYKLSLFLGNEVQYFELPRYTIALCFELSPVRAAKSMALSEHDLVRESLVHYDVNTRSA